MLHKNYFLVLLAAFFWLYDCSAEVPLKIGVMLCQTGPCAQTGMSSLKGIQLAREEINNRGGILGRQVQLEVLDTREASGGSGAVTAFQALSSDPSINIIIGTTWDGGGLPLVPLLKRNPSITLISPSIGVAEFSRGAKNIFNLWPLDEESSKVLAKYAIRNNWRRVGILSSQNNWAQAQAKNFSNAINLGGGEVVSNQEPMPLQTDLSVEVLKIIKSDPDVVLFTEFSHMPVAARKLRQQGYQGAFFAVQMDSTMIETANGGLEGAIFPKFRTASNEFIAAFQKKFNEEPQMAADTGYDSLKIIQAVIQQEGHFDPSTFSAVLSNLVMEGASGSISFDKDRVIRRTPDLYRVTGQGFTKVD